MQILAFTLDVGAAVAACLASLLWYRASGRTLRRVSRAEEIDAADLNRIVTAINRSQLLNARAAMAATVAAGLAAIRFALAAMAD
jgi:hypothetical protein